MPDSKLPFTITTDASEFTIGAILSQNYKKVDQPVTYESRKLSLAEQNYLIHKKELLIIIYAIYL